MFSAYNVWWFLASSPREKSAAIAVAGVVAITPYIIAAPLKRIIVDARFAAGDFRDVDLDRQFTLLEAAGCRMTCGWDAAA